MTPKPTPPANVIVREGKFTAEPPAPPDAQPPRFISESWPSAAFVIGISSAVLVGSVLILLLVKP